MTSKIYRSAQGKSVDLGVLRLQNEHVRAVGNMKVNARGDKLDSQNRVVETKSQQIQRQNNRLSTDAPDQTVHSSAAKARRAAQLDTAQPDSIVADPTPNDQVPETPAIENITPVAVAPATDPVDSTAVASVAKGAGLAGAIARTRTIKQELDRTRRQQAQDSGIKKI